jgi:hypothetical protein
MGNLQVPSGNQVLDLGIISGLVTAINELQDDVQTKNAKVYINGVSPAADTQTTRLAIVTQYAEVPVAGSTALTRVFKNIKLGKTFAYNPIVTVTPVLQTSITTNSTPDVSIIITRVGVSEIDVVVVSNSAKKASVGVNVIAIGVL